MTGFTVPYLMRCLKLWYLIHVIWVSFLRIISVWKVGCKFCYYVAKKLRYSPGSFDIC